MVDADKHGVLGWGKWVSQTIDPKYYVKAEVSVGILEMRRMWR